MLVNGAAGAVGHVVGQVAKIKLVIGTFHSYQMGPNVLTLPRNSFACGTGTGTGGYRVVFQGHALPPWGPKIFYFRAVVS